MKAEGFTIEVWLAAMDALGVHSMIGNHGRITSVARAIMAATEAEREACAQLLDAAADQQKEAWDKFIASGAKGPATSFEAIYRGQSAAIRKRGEP